MKTQTINKIHQLLGNENFCIALNFYLLSKFLKGELRAKHISSDNMIRFVENKEYNKDFFHNYNFKDKDFLINGISINLINDILTSWKKENKKQIVIIKEVYINNFFNTKILSKDRFIANFSKRSCYKTDEVMVMLQNNKLYRKCNNFCWLIESFINNKEYIENPTKYLFNKEVKKIDIKPYLSFNRLNDVFIKPFIKKAVIFCFVFLSISLFSQTTGDYKTSTSGNWNNISSWQRYNGTSWVAANAFPANVNGIISIQSGHIITINASVTIDQTTINSGGKILYSAGTLTINNGTGNDLTINGAFERTSANNIAGAGNIVVTSGGTYKHNYNGGNIATSTWNTGSILEIANTVTFDDLPAKDPFSNVYVTGGNTIISDNSTNTTTTISGDLIITNGSLTCVKDLNTTNFITTVNVTGNCTVNGGNLTLTGDLNSASQDKEDAVLNISGNFTLNNSLSTVIVSGPTNIGSRNINNKIVVNGNFIMSSGNFILNQATTGTNNIGDLHVKGNFTHTGGTISANGSSQPLKRIYFSGTTLQNIESIGQSTFGGTGGYINFYVQQTTATGLCQIATNKNFEISTISILNIHNNSAVTNELDVYGALICKNNLSFSSALLTIKDGGNLVWNTINNINTILSNITFTNNSNITYRGSSSLIPGLIVTGKTWGNMVFESTSGTWTSSNWSGGSATNIMGNFTVGTGVSLLNSATGIHTFWGNYTINGDVILSGGIQDFVFSGNAKNIGGTSEILFKKLTFATGANYSLLKNITIASADMNIQNNSILDAQTYTISTDPSQIINVNGTVKTSNLEAFQCMPTSTISSTNTPVINLGGTSTIEYNANSGYQKLTARIYDNLIVSGNATKLLCNDALATNFTINGGVFDLNGHTLSLNNSPVWNGGYVLSEKTDNSSKIKINIGANIGTYLFPFGNSTGTYIPFKLSLTAGNIGNVTVSTFQTANDLTPYPAQVTHLKNIAGIDNSPNTVHRFWQIDKDGISGTANILFSYDSINEKPFTSNSSINAQRWNTVNQKWEIPLPSQISDKVLCNVIVSNVTNFSPWALSTTDSPLPISLLTFGAKLKNEKIYLNWKTATETNNNYFTIERSIDNNNFDKVKTIEGAGNSTNVNNYATVDDNPMTGISYYRLKQTDFDGKFTYSKSISVVLDNPLIRKYHYHIVDNRIEIHFTCDAPNDMERLLTIEIFNPNGQNIYKQTMQVNENIFEYPITLDNGSYILNLGCNFKTSLSDKIIVFKQ